MALNAIVDGLASAAAAVVTIVVVLPPVWFTHIAYRAGLAPWWAYLPCLGLLAIGLLMTVSFLRKASGGIAPSRDRRR